MSKVNIDINTEDLEKVLDQLSGKEMMTAQRAHIVEYYIYPSK